VSAAYGAEQVAACAVAARLAKALLDAKPAKPLLLNTNFPGGSAWPLRTTRLGARIYRDEIEFRRDPRGREYLWIGGPGVEHRAIAGSDTEAFDEGVIGVTPLVLDLWDRDEQKQAEQIVSMIGQS
jgi:5'-nucleotidase